jgi:hypothetical protein
MEGLFPDSGTSASTPLWASLASQVNAIFKDQGLPNLGYANDLFYIAAAIAPAGFNDVTWGNNTSSFLKGGPYTSDGEPITPTGYGYYAGPGYDLVTGLGTPNGVLVARALTAIAHTRMWGTRSTGGVRTRRATKRRQPGPISSPRAAHRSTVRATATTTRSACSTSTPAT